MLTESLQSTEENILQNPGDGESESAGKREIGCWMALVVYSRIIRFTARLVLFWLAQGGFSLYTYFAVCHLIAPYFAIVSGLGLRDPFVIIGSILTIIVFYPYFEVLIVLPVGIYASMGNFSHGLWRISPLHWAIKGLDYAINIMHERTLFAVFIIFITTIIIGALTVTLVIYFAMDRPWSAIIMLLFTFPPIIFALYNILLLIFHSWVYLFQPSEMVQFSKEEKEESDDRWPIISLWENYAKDSTAAPIQFRKCTKDCIIQFVITILFCILMILNIIILIQHFNWIYLLSSFVTWISFPFLIRFHIFKIFRKSNYEYHARFLKIGRILFGVNLVIFVYFLITIIIAIVMKPTKYEARTFSSSGQVPIVNQTTLFAIPSICGTQFEGISMVQYAGIVESGYDSAIGEKPIDEKLTLIFGRDWNQSLEIVNTLQTDFSIYEHIKYTTNDLDLIVIASKNSISDGLLAFSLASLYRIPEQIFAMIPFATMFYNGLLNIMIGAFNIPADLYNPRRLISAYLEPVQNYIENLVKAEKRIFIIGSSVGGAVAKILGMHFGIKAIAFNSPEIRLWFIGDLSKKSLDLSFTHNILIPAQMYTGSETGGMVEYIPFDDFPMNPASSSATICILGIQCQVYDHFRDFCEKSISNDILTKMQKLSPYH
jgi:hypothetical protein